MSRPPAETFYGGYAGYFTDPDGHVWEIAHNPGLPLREDGWIDVPDVGRPSSEGHAHMPDPGQAGQAFW